MAHHESGLPPHSYVLYIGQTGARANGRTLRLRIGNYFEEQTNPKRAHIYKFLNKWKTCLTVHFAAVDPKKADLLKVEAKLNDALIPPYSIRDFSPRIRKAELAGSLVQEGETLQTAVALLGDPPHNALNATVRGCHLVPNWPNWPNESRSPSTL